MTDPCRQPDPCYVADGTKPGTYTATIRESDDFYTPRRVCVFTISKTFKFEAAHQLPGLPPGHKCGRLHGHSYTAEIVLSADELIPPGFVMDFADLQPVGDYLDRIADHHLLNDLIGEPTSERLAQHLYEWVLANVPIRDGAALERVRVSETATSRADYTGPHATAAALP